MTSRPLTSPLSTPSPPEPTLPQRRRRGSKGRWRASVIALLLAAGLFAPAARAFPPKNCVETQLQTLLTNATAPQRRALGKLDELKVASFNALNLEESVGKVERTHTGGFRRDEAGELKVLNPKAAHEEAKITAIAKVIQEIDADLIVLQEVEGDLSLLQRFVDRRLESRYRPYLAVGNDERGINVGFLVKSDLPISIEMQTHRGETWVDPLYPLQPSKLFSRDVPALIVRAEGQPENSPPLFVLMGNHGKSKRPRELELPPDTKATAELPDGKRLTLDLKDAKSRAAAEVPGAKLTLILPTGKVRNVVWQPGLRFYSNKLADPESTLLRQSQYQRAAEIIANRYYAQWGKNTRLIFAGDFNTRVPDAPELAALHTQANLSESFEVLQRLQPQKQIAESERVTHTYHPRDGPTEKNQIDGIFLSPGLHSDVKDVRVYRYKDAQGKEIPLPETYEDREKNPSDHFPIQLVLKAKPIVERYAKEVGLKIAP